MLVDHRHAASVLCLASALAVSGCSKSALEGLDGRWVGSITCAGEASDLAMSLQTSGGVISGSATTRTKDSNKDWTVKGSQSEQTVWVDCADDRCAEERECAGRSGSDAAVSRCVSNRCLPCRERKTRQVVTLTLADNNVQLPDPVLVLERIGERRLEGGIELFCAPGGTPPRVLVTKE